MKNEFVTYTDGTTENYNMCDYCSSKEHISTQGIVSVDPKYEEFWFCSYYCLHTKKHGNKNTKNNKTKNNKTKNNKNNKF